MLACRVAHERHVGDRRAARIAIGSVAEQSTAHIHTSSAIAVAARDGEPREQRVARVGGVAGDGRAPDHPNHVEAVVGPVAVALDVAREDGVGGAVVRRHVAGAAAGRVATEDLDARGNHEAGVPVAGRGRRVGPLGHADHVAGGRVGERVGQRLEGRRPGLAVARGRGARVHEALATADGDQRDRDLTASAGAASSGPVGPRDVGPDKAARRDERRPAAAAAFVVAAAAAAVPAAAAAAAETARLTARPEAEGARPGSSIRECPGPSSVAAAADGAAPTPAASCAEPAAAAAAANEPAGPARPTCGRPVRRGAAAANADLALPATGPGHEQERLLGAPAEDDRRAAAAAAASETSPTPSVADDDGEHVSSQEIERRRNRRAGPAPTASITTACGDAVEPVVGDGKRLVVTRKGERGLGERGGREREQDRERGESGGREHQSRGHRVGRVLEVVLEAGSVVGAGAGGPSAGRRSRSRATPSSEARMATSRAARSVGAGVGRGAGMGRVWAVL